MSPPLPAPHLRKTSRWGYLTTNFFTKQAKKRGFDMSELQAVLDRLCAEEPLDNPEENPKGKTNHKPAIARTPIKELLPQNEGSG